MKYFDYDMENYDLHVIKTDRFKTIFYSVNIRFDDKKETEIYTSLLSRMLVQTSSHYPTLRDINVACASIYDPFYEIRILESGTQDVLRLSASFANEKYTEKGMNEANFKFLTEFLFEPKIVDGGFDREIFEVQKQKVLEYYKTLKDSPRDYASARLSENMQVKKYKMLKLEELIQKIGEVTAESLYDFYKEIMAEGKLDVFVCGDVDENEIKQMMNNIIKFSGHNQKQINHFIKQETYNQKPNIILENSNNTQSNLIVGCKLEDLTDFQRNYVFVLYSWILGGGMMSLLNQTVREKNSLCYYIYAVRKHLYECMRIYAGINGEDFDKTYELIQREMKNIEKGNFSDELFAGVKEIYYNSLIKIEDVQSDLVNNYISEVFLKIPKASLRKKQMDKVTKEDVMALAKKVHIDTVYLLKGER